jgi:hypothetical protein
MRRTTKWQQLMAVGLLGVFFVQAVATIPQLSLTADEPVYLGAGYAFLRSGDLRLATSAQHPPLMQELVALPLLLQPGPELASLEGWDTAEMARFAPAFVAWYGEALDAATFAARMVVVGLALLWAAFVFRWAADWFGPWGGLVALTLFVFDPNILAHATLATNDAGWAALSLIALFAATRLLRRSSSSWRYLVLAGLALGGSLSSKSSGFFTALALVALLSLEALLKEHPQGRKRRMSGARHPQMPFRSHLKILPPHHITRRLGRAALQLALILCLGLLVLWAIYGFESRPYPLATQWKVWGEMRGHLAEGHTSYLRGQIRDTGGLTYYPLAFVLKTPPLTLVLLALGLVAALAGGPRRWRAMLPLWVYLGGYGAATLLSSVGTGYRFLLPALPLGFILAGGLFREGAPWLRHPLGRRVGWAALALLSAVVALRSYPHYLTYFNFIAGGPAGGHRYLVDSNLDWGQSFKTLRAYLDRQGIERVQLSYYTYADPALYGVRYQPIAPAPGAAPLLPARFNPAPGIYAIGATTLQGVMMADPDVYSWFRQREPLARPGDAIWLYAVKESRPQPAWLAQCTVPAAPLSPEVVTAGFGRDDLRLIYFDCTQSWLYPSAGETPGWYALHHDEVSEQDPFVQGRVKSLHLSYEQRTDRASPAFVIYEQPLQAVKAGCSAAPQPLDGPLDFLGYTLPENPVRPGDTVEIETCWRVTGLPGRPLSLMLHLIGPDGGPVMVGDGLGVPVENWQVGDVLVQRHTLSLPADAPSAEYTLLTGAYWLDTLERWPVHLPDGTTADQLHLDRITVLD